MPSIPIPRSREKWLALRQKYIGGSEIAALFGEQPPYAMSRFTLWHVKAGLVPPPPVDEGRIAFGNAFEEPIARLIAQRENWTIEKGRYERDPDCPGAAATLDYVVTAGGPWPGPGAFEIKNVGYPVWAATWKRHLDDQEGEPPAHILLQNQHQMMCSGMQWGAVGACVGGNDLKVALYQRSEPIIASMRERISEFWKSIRERRPPQPDAGSGHAIASLYPRLVDQRIDLRGNPVFADACRRYSKAARLHAALGEAKEASLLAIKGAMADYKRAEGDGWRVSCSVTPATEARAESRRYTVKPIEGIAA